MPGNFYESLQTAMQANPDKLCFLCPAGESYTFAEIDRLAGQFASTLQADGVEPGDRVVVQVEKSVAAYALYLGALRCGAVFVPLNTAYTTAELSYFIEDAAPRVLILDPERTIALNAHQHDNAANPNAGQKPEPLHRTLSDDPQEGLWKTAREHQPIAEVVDRSEEDLAAIVYTSGTTGRSKGAMISHRALETNAKTLQRIWGYEPNDVLLHALPIFHIHGLFIAMHPTLLNGSTTLFLKAFNATVVRQHLAQATILMGVPTFYLRLLAEPGFGAHDCDSIRLFVSGSAPLTAQASQAWTDATGSRILERYGMTEAGIISSNPLAGERIPGTVGFALPDVDVRVCDDNGAEVRAGEVGTLEVRGPNLFSGYWRKPEKTTEELREDGFFVTGDLCTQQDDGRITIVGRAKDLIISGGYNIYPKEIESVLDEVDGVTESAVVGVPHPDLGEGVVAVLVGPTPVPDAVLKSALEEKLARFKHPRRFVWIDALPRNAMGKVQKNHLGARYEQVYQAP